MMKAGFLAAVMAVTVTSPNAQQTFLARYLGSVEGDSQLVAQRTHAQIVRTNSFTMPFISDAEVRLRKGDYYRNLPDDIAGLRYSLRFQPRGFGETKALKAYHKAQESFEEELGGNMFDEQLVERYLTAIDLFERKMVEASYRDLITLYEDRIRVMDQLKNSVDFDLNDLIKAEKELSKLTINHIEEAQEVAVMCNNIGVLVGDTAFDGFDTARLISVAGVSAIIDSIEFKLDEGNRILRYLKSRFELSEQRFELERAQNRNLFSYFEFSYDHPNMVKELNKKDRNAKLGDTRNAFIFDVGIKIPGISTDLQDVARRQIDFLKDKEEFEQLRRNIHAKMMKDESDIRALIKQYEFLTARENEVDAEASLKKYLQLSGVNPLVLLSIKENLIKNGVEKSTVYFSILRNFIYVLDVTGRLSQKPICNYLSVRREVIEP